MRVVILGGYGVFGSRLAELLVRDGHDVLITGRDERKLTELSKRLNCRHLALDHRNDPQALFAVSPEVVVDAAGPFQSYRNDPYIVPRLCLEHGADYLDLSDDAEFTQGITQLDDRARSANRRLLSGASSVPGISSAIAAGLCTGMDEILLIDTAIFPGNRAPRGASVISSIVSQLGTTSSVYRGGVWRSQSSWSDPQQIGLAPNLSRTARFIEVPDIRLFPKYFGAKSVIFRAGLELGILNMAMSFIAVIRRQWMFAVAPWQAEVFRKVANLFLPFGTDRGGMRVLVVGASNKTVIRREWRLIAEAGDGPYIPAVMARALIRKLSSLPEGSRACLAETSRAKVESAMSDLAVSVETVESQSPTLFQTALAERWEQLPHEVQALHSVQDVESFSGTAKVTRGTTLMARVAAWFFGFPHATDQIALTITKTRTQTGETWERNFGGRVFRSYLTPAPDLYRYRERFWLLNYEQDLPVQNGCMHLPVRRGWFLGIPLPRFVLPISDSREYSENGVFKFDVSLIAPLGGGLIVRYRGQVKPDREDSAGSDTGSPKRALVA
jgi:saccharopine dehydrogenase-like NADP-dependent oxidoreductase